MATTIASGVNLFSCFSYFFRKYHKMSNLVAVHFLKFEITCTFTLSCFVRGRNLPNQDVFNEQTLNTKHFYISTLTNWVLYYFFPILITDINECDTNNENCEQICENSQGSYQCKCHSGFSLHKKHKCYGKSAEYIVAKWKYYWGHVSI